MSYRGAQAIHGRLLSIFETVRFWRDRHGCRGFAETPIAKRERDDPTRVIRVDWQGCSLDGAVRLYRVEGGGHRLPALGGDAEASELVQRYGARNRDIETAEEIWTFFSRFTR